MAREQSSTLGRVVQSGGGRLVVALGLWLALGGPVGAATMDLNSQRRFDVGAGETRTGSTYSCPLRRIVWTQPLLPGVRVAGWAYVEVAALWPSVPKGFTVTSSSPVGNYGWTASATNNSNWSGHLVIALTCRYTY